MRNEMKGEEEGEEGGRRKEEEEEGGGDGMHVFFLCVCSDFRFLHLPSPPLLLDRLVTVHRSMLPSSAEETVNLVMDMTAARLDHVVAHSGVGWWRREEEEEEKEEEEGRGGGGDEPSPFQPYYQSSVLDVPLEDYEHMSSQLGCLHYAAAELLLPRLARQV